MAQKAFTTTGPFGINVISTSNPLHVVGTVAADDKIAFIQNTSTTGASGFVASDDGGTKFMTVGILNTASSLDTSTYGEVGDAFLRASSSAAGLTLNAASSTGYIRFRTGGTASSERMRIDSTGFVGIGKSANLADILEIVNAAGRAYITLTSTGATTAGVKINAGAGSSNWSIDAGTGSTHNLQIYDAVNNVARLQINESGQVSVNGVTGYGGALEVFSTGSSPHAWISMTRGSADIAGPYIALVKSRDTTASGRTAILSGDDLGTLSFQGTNGTGHLTGAWIKSTASAAPTGTNVQGNLIFSTTGASDTVPQPRMTISSSGLVGFGTTSPGYTVTAVANSTTPYAVSGSTVVPDATAVAIENKSQVDGSYTGLLFSAVLTNGTKSISYIGNTTSSVNSGYSGTMVFGRRTGVSAYAESMRLDANGNLGIGAIPTYAKRVEVLAGAHNSNLAANGYALRAGQADGTGPGWLSGLFLESDSDGVPSISIYSPNAVTDGANTAQKAISVLNSSSNQQIIFYSGGGIERIRITSVGAIALSGSANTGTTGQALLSNGAGSAAAWGNVSATSLSGQVPAANGGTGLNITGSGVVVYSSGVGTLTATTGTGNVVMSNAPTLTGLVSAGSAIGVGTSSPFATTAVNAGKTGEDTNATGVYGNAILGTTTMTSGRTATGVRGDASSVLLNATAFSNYLYGGNFSATHTGGNTTNIGGVYGVINSASVTTSDATYNKFAYVYGSTSSASANGSTAQVSTLTGHSGQATVATGSTATTVKGIDASFSVIGTATNAYGVYSQAAASGAGTVTNSYVYYGGISITGTVTNRYGIYINGNAGNNYFGDALQVGGSALTGGPSAGVGIGITPTGTVGSLRVSDSIYTTTGGNNTTHAGALYYSGGTYRLEAVGAAVPLTLATNGSVRATIDTSGNFGIGASSPASTLEAMGDITGRDVKTANTNANSRWFGGAYTGNKATLAYISGTSGSNVVTIGGGTSGGEPASMILFNTGTAGSLGTGTERMRIDSLGNVGIGITPSATQGFIVSKTGQDAVSQAVIGAAVLGTTAITGYRNATGVTGSANSSLLNATAFWPTLTGGKFTATYSAGSSTAIGEIYGATNTASLSTSDATYNKLSAVNGSANYAYLSGSTAQALAVSGVLSQVDIATGLSATTVKGINSSVTTAGSSSAFYNVYANSTVSVGANVTNSYLYYGTLTPSGTITNKYGVFISSTAGNNYFGDALQVGGTALTGDSSAGVGIGVTPTGTAGTLRVSDAIYTTNGTNTTHTGALYYGGGAYKLEAVGTAVPLNFATNGAVQAAISTAGIFTVGNPTITGDAKIQVTNGVRFGGTVSTDSKTLDYYEEGTWTPVISGTTTAGAGTYTTQYGAYTRTGNRVTINASIVISAHTGTGNMIITGLPFTSGVTQQMIHIGAASLTYSNQLVAYVPASTTQITLATMATGVALTSVPMDTACTIWVTGTYAVA